MLSEPESEKEKMKAHKQKHSTTRNHTFFPASTIKTYRFRDRAEGMAENEENNLAAKKSSK